MIYDMHYTWYIYQSLYYTDGIEWLTDVTATVCKYVYAIEKLLLKIVL